MSDKLTRSARTEPLLLDQEYRVLSIHPEWAWAIIFAGKDIENRSWSTRYRGKLLIHASSKRNSKQQLEAARASICARAGLKPSELPRAFPTSAILGSVEFIDCVENSKSKWAGSGNVHWLLRDPKPLAQPIENVMGKLQIWRWTPSRRDLPTGSTEAPAQSARSAAPAKNSKRAPEPSRNATRGIDEMSAEEILVALRASTSATPANEGDVLRAASRHLGFARMGSRVEQVLRAHVRTGVKHRVFQWAQGSIRSRSHG